MRKTSFAVCLAAAALSCGPALAAGPHLHDHAHSHDTDAATPDLLPAPSGLATSLEDKKRKSGRGRIAWSTHWKLCWQPVESAAYYEIRLMTSEGAPRAPKRLDATCFRIEAAAGENPVSEGLPHRDLMLTMQAAQLSAQIRAVLADGRKTAWTAAQDVGTLTPPAGN